MSDEPNKEEVSLEPAQYSFQHYIDDLVGRILPERYRIESLIASNPFNAVFSTVNEKNDQIVTMRVFRRVVKDEEDYQYKRFKQEVKRLSGLKHPNIANIVDHGLLKEGLPFIVMESVVGPTLEEVLNSQNRIDPDQTVLIFSQVARAVQFAHDQGVLHETLKPSRIIISENEKFEPVVRTTGFGLLALHNKLGVPLKTPKSRNGLIGTAAYMAPEQCVEGVEMDGRADVYAMGCIMYECLSGQVPFMAPDEKVIKMHCEANPVPLSVLRKDLNLPKRLMAIIEKCMEKSAVRRYQFVRDLQADLEKDIDPADREKQKPLPEGIAKAQQRAQESKEIPIKQFALLMGGFVALVVILFAGYYIYSFTSKFANSASWHDKLVAGQKAITDGKLAEAEESFRSALVEARNFPGKDMRIASTLNELGNLNIITGHYTIATENLKEALDIEHAVLTRDDEATARTLELLSAAEFASGRMKDAEDHARAGCEVAEHLSGDNTIRIYQSYVQLFNVLLAKNNLNEANVALNKIKTAIGATPAMLSFDVITGYKQAGALMDEANGKYPAAEKELLDILGTRQEKIGLESLPSIETMVCLGKLFAAEKKYDKALAIMNSAYDAKKKLMDESSPALLELEFNIGQVYEKSGKKEEAEKRLRQVLEASEKVFGANSPDRLPYIDELAKFLRAQKRVSAAEVYETEALNIRHPERVPKLGKGR